MKPIPKGSPRLSADYDLRSRGRSGLASAMRGKECMMASNSRRVRCLVRSALGSLARISHSFDATLSRRAANAFPWAWRARHLGQRGAVFFDREGHRSLGPASIPSLRRDSDRVTRTGVASFASRLDVAIAVDLAIEGVRA
jgi:hypothetical protein